MPDHELTMNLARLVIATAWADGKLEHEEVNALKDVLFNLPEIWEEDWQRLQLYFDSPVQADEAQRLLDEVLDSIRSQEDRNFVVTTLEHVIRCDGNSTSAEQDFVSQIRQAIEDRSGFLGGMKGMLKSVLGRRSASASKAPNRENHFEDYIKNEVYHGVVHVNDKDINLPDDQLRKLCLAAGLMAAVAHTEEVVDEGEQRAIASALGDAWNIPPDEAALVAEVSCQKAIKGLDFSRLNRSFFEVTTHEERSDFLKCLFQIANATGKTSHDEIERIRDVADHLKIAHKDLIAAKLTISREDRGGL